MNITESPHNPAATPEDLLSFGRESLAETVQFQQMLDEPTKTWKASPHRADASANSESLCEKPEDSTGSRKSRYSLLRCLGQGGFGIVYLGLDNDLQRQVAIKLARRPAEQADFESVLHEARLAAALDHPNLVPVYDVGWNSMRQLFVISKYIEGQDLSQRLSEGPMSIPVAVNCIITLADALEHANQTAGLVHRDIKPSNILIDQSGTVYLCDFGLAFIEGVAQGPILAGTPAYMSPEQASGEGHRIDHRSDLFSLGVVLYELLTAHRPFEGPSEGWMQRLLHQSPPRFHTYSPDIPGELERITMKCLAKRIQDRYARASDLADDLRAWQLQATTSVPSQPSVIPKGFRSFDASDHPFFLGLLPGVRDRYGVPESINAWKRRLEDHNPNTAFPVGLLYGPSGCGKSSYVQAGLIPCLSRSTHVLFIEATPHATEERVRQALLLAFPTLPTELDLPQLLQLARSDTFSKPGEKIVLVIDQFEQWLQRDLADEGNSESWETQVQIPKSESSLPAASSSEPLLRALRQCDGGRVQALLMVRDEFWMDISRFFQDLEIPLQENHNCVMLDLFDLPHASRVLENFGRAYHSFPSDGSLQAEHERFLEQAIALLNRDGRIVCMDLIVLVELVKRKAWVPDTLRGVHDLAAIGIAYLDSYFDMHGLSLSHATSRLPAQAILSRLVPEHDHDRPLIKRSSTDRDTLCQVAGLDPSSTVAETIFLALENDLKLIVRTDAKEPSGTPYYQLSHDYLIPAIRNWISRDAQKSLRGRARKILASYGDTWSARQEDRFLPNVWDWLMINVLTRHEQWTASQSKMMKAAHWQNGKRVLVVALLGLFAVLCVGTFFVRMQQRSDDQQLTILADRLANETGRAIPLLLDRLETFPSTKVCHSLQQRFQKGTHLERLRIAFGLAHFGLPNWELMFQTLAEEQLDPNEAGNFLLAMSTQPTQALDRLREQATIAKSHQNWRYLARLASLALQLGDASHAEWMWSEKLDPLPRLHLLMLAPDWCPEPQRIPLELANVEDDYVRSGLCLVLGGIPNPSRVLVDRWTPVMIEWYQQIPDAGIHSAAAWSLSQWKQTLPRLLDADDPPKDRDWWPTQGLSLVRIPSTSLHWPMQEAVIGASFWMATTELSNRQFRDFMNDNEYEGLKPKTWKDGDDLLPADSTDWFGALMYCNWLSAKLGREACYTLTPVENPATPDSAFEVQFHGQANGIRLPTEREWDYVLDEGNLPIPQQGYYLDLYEHQAWLFTNSRERLHEVGSKICNAYGIHDAFGNIDEVLWTTSDWSTTTLGGSYKSGIRLHRLPIASSKHLTGRGFRVCSGPIAKMP